MKKRYKATYYEYGLTQRTSRTFYTLFFACLWRAWIEARYSCMAAVRIEEIENE